MSEDDFPPRGPHGVFDPAFRAPNPKDIPIEIIGVERATPGGDDLEDLLKRGSKNGWEKWDFGLDRGIGGIEGILDEWGFNDPWDFGDAPAEGLGGDPRDGFDGGLGMVSIGHVHIVVTIAEPLPEGELEELPNPPAFENRDPQTKGHDQKDEPPHRHYQHNFNDDPGKSPGQGDYNRKGAPTFKPPEGWGAVTPDPMREDTGGRPSGILWQMQRQRGLRTHPAVSDPGWRSDDARGKAGRLTPEFLDLAIGGGVTDPVPYGDDDPRRLGQRSGGVFVRPRRATSDDPHDF